VRPEHSHALILRKDRPYRQAGGNQEYIDEYHVMIAPECYLLQWDAHLGPDRGGRIASICPEPNSLGHHGQRRSTGTARNAYQLGVKSAAK